MKKILYILFVTTYLFLNTGISIATHFCGEEIYSIRLATNPIHEEPDGCCSDEFSSSCCKTVYTFVKISDSQKAVAGKDVKYLQAALLPRYSIQNDRINSSNELYFPKVEQFPPGSTICIINCTFLI